MIRGRSTLGYVLEALLPYSEANIRLIYKPHQFFTELEKISEYKSRSLQNAFYSLKKRGLIEFNDGQPRLTPKGYQHLLLFKPKEIPGAHLMIVFDIPEKQRNKRYQLRNLIRELKFKQVQKSVWVTKYECREYLNAEVKQLNVGQYVKIFEAREIISSS